MNMAIAGANHDMNRGWMYGNNREARSMGRTFAMMEVAFSTPEPSYSRSTRPKARSRPKARPKAKRSHVAERRNYQKAQNERLQVTEYIQERNILQELFVGTDSNHEEIMIRIVNCRKILKKIYGNIDLKEYGNKQDELELLQAYARVTLPHCWPKTLTEDNVGTWIRFVTWADYCNYQTRKLIEELVWIQHRNINNLIQPDFEELEDLCDGKYQESEREELQEIFDSLRTELEALFRKLDMSDTEDVRNEISQEVNKHLRLKKWRVRDLIEIDTERSSPLELRQALANKIEELNNEISFFSKPRHLIEKLERKVGFPESRTMSS